MRKKDGVRLWPVLTILISDVLAVSGIWLFFASIRQYKVLGTIIVQVVAILLSAIWLLFFSRLKWKVRLKAFSGIALSIAVLFWLFPTNEVSGDLVPKFEWRWAAKSYQTEILTSTHDVTPDIMPAAAVFSYPRFLGPNRNGVLDGIQLDTDWRAHPPKLIWKQAIGQGWSAFSVQGQQAITQEQRGDEELVISYDLQSGKIRWQHRDVARFEAIIAGIGPRATPTIDGDRVYTLGATGILNCLNLNDGSLVWQKNILQENNAKLKEWGTAGSPLILDEKVVVSAGGPNNQSLIAYNKKTGEGLWANGSDRAGYSSPMFATIADLPQILIFNWEHVAAHDPETGEILWEFPWSGDTQRVAQPVVLPEDRVFITTGYGVGSKLIKITRTENGRLEVTQLWKSNRMKAKFTNVIPYGEFIFGLDDGILACIDLKDGKRRWKRGRYGHGQMILVDDLLLITTESGEVVLVEPSQDKHQEIARFAAIEGKTWNNPALAGPYLLVRNSEEAACYKLPLLN